MARYVPKNFDRLLGTPGFSDELLKNHFELYKGYVKSTSDIDEELKAAQGDGKLSSEGLAGLRHRFGWEFDGMRLHELYFENMTKRGVVPDNGSLFHRQAGNDFGSYEKWAKDFKSVGGMRGIGWAITYWEPASRRLINAWIAEHDTGHLAGCPIVLVMDVFEHAFTLDYGTKKAEYIEAFFAAIDWTAIAGRMETTAAAPGVRPAVLEPVLT